MPKYVIRDYQKGFEQDQARIGIAVARDWIWPFAYDLEDLLQIHAQPDFDPATRHYCFLGDEMVGYIFSLVNPPGEDGIITATLDFPRLLPGHEGAAGLLIEKALDVLKKKGVSRVMGRVTTMCPGDIPLAESAGFSICDWGYKLYYSYKMASGKLTIPEDSASEIDPGKDLAECAALAARWYKRPPEWCLTRLQAWHARGIITHPGVRAQGKLIAACMAAPNDLRPSTAAIYYIFSPDEQSLKPMLAKVVSRCVAFGTHNLIVDLINEHLPFAPVYQQLGFHKVAEWARCEKILALECADEIPSDHV